MPHKHTVLIDDDNERNMLDCEFDNVKKSNYSRKLNIVLRSYFSRNGPDITSLSPGEALAKIGEHLGPEGVKGLGGLVVPVKGPGFAVTKADISNALLEKNFEQFWNAYPNKKSKAQAKRAWMKIKPDDSLLLKIADNLRTRKDWEDKQYIPHGSTYLNNARWEDQEAEEVPKYVDSEAFKQKMRDKHG